MKIVAISDVHQQWDGLELPTADALVIAGDLCERADSSFAAANAWLGTLLPRYSRVIYVPGNHDWSIIEQPRKYRTIAPLLLDAMLVDRTTEIGDLRLHAMPWDYADRDFPEMLIPTGLDVLVTHEPPFGIRDWSARARDDRLGNRTLRSCVEAVTPRLHLFGHCHMAYGIEVRGATTFANVAVCGDPKKYYRLAHPATVVDIDSRALSVTPFS